MFTGGHYMTGPIYVCGAEAGDVLEVLNHLLLCHVSHTFHRPAKGFFVGWLACLLAV